MRNLRLDEQEKAALLYAIEGVGEVYLFGSRVDDGKKGGDIDILVFTKRPAFAISQQVAVRFFSRCEEKIDVVVMDPDNLTEEQRAFADSIEKVRIQ